MENKLITVKQFFDINDVYKWFDDFIPENGYGVVHTIVDEMPSGAYRASIIQLKYQMEFNFA